MAILEDSEIAMKAEGRTRFRLKSAGTKLNQQANYLIFFSN